MVVEKKKSKTSRKASTPQDGPIDPEQAELAALLHPEVREVFYSLYKKFTEVQIKAGKELLAHKDVVVESPTGSGKTLAFALPLLTIMRKKPEKWKSNEIGAIILSPSRELAIQIAKVIEPFAKHFEYIIKTTIGGIKQKPEEELTSISKNGCNILIATPGRLEKLLTLDKDQIMRRMMKSIEVLIVDEADRFTEAAFQTSMNEIMSAIPKLRRTGLFSATQAKEREDLIKFSLRSPATIKLKEQEHLVCPSSLKNYYTVCDANLKLITLLEFIRSRPDKKILIFLSSCQCVAYFNSIFPRLLKKRKIFAVHGKKQMGRTTEIESFRKAPGGVMLCTDVLSRGIDIDDIDWVVQFDVPRTSSWFVHRAGRTSRCGREGSALLLLTPQETAFVQFVEKYEMVKLDELKIKTVTSLKAYQLLDQIRKFAIADRSILIAGTKAFVSFVEAYKRHDCYIVCSLKDHDLIGLAHSYGLLRLPKMEELSSRTDLDTFKRSDYDTSKIPYLNKNREQKRLKEQEDKIAIKEKRKQAALEKKEKKAKKRTHENEPKPEESNGPSKKKKLSNGSNKSDKESHLKDDALMRKMKGGRLGKKDLKAIQ